MEIVYVAHTQSGVFMLDEQGVCRWAVARPGTLRDGGPKIPERIVGAQYVATLDLEAPGGLVVFPRVGAPMLFAATDETGRIKLVRTPPLERFEDRRNRPMRRPLASKLDADEQTPIAPMPVRKSTPPPEAYPVPLLRPLQSRIAARIPPAPSFPTPTPASGVSSSRPGVQSIPVRVRGASYVPMKRLARGN